MLEWIASASVLMFVLIGLRFLLKGKINPYLQYALWALVLIRLLIPFQFGSAKISVANAVDRAAVSAPSEAPSAVGYAGGETSNIMPVEITPAANLQEQKPQQQNIAPQEAQKAEKTVKTGVGTQLSVTGILKIVWLAGMGTVALWLLLANLRFSLKLHRSRQRIEVSDCPLRLYRSAAIDTPCLFGLLRPAIYMTPKVCDDAAVLRYAITHELAHRRHGDHLWPVLRGVCLAVHWYNPLVWISAVLSRNDAELCCDEATIHRLGEAERAEYGRTLLRLTCEKRPALIVTATTMTGNRHCIKDRILRIARKPKMTIFTLIVVLIIAAISVGCTFTGAAKKPVEPSIEEAPTTTSKTTERASGKIMFSDKVYEYSIDETTACALSDEMMTNAIPVSPDVEPKKNFECSTDARHVRVLMMENAKEGYSLLIEEDGEQYLTNDVVVPKIESVEWVDGITEGVDEALANAFGKQAQEYADAFVRKTELYSHEALTEGTILELPDSSFASVEIPIINFKEHTAEQMYDRMRYLQNTADRMRTEKAMYGMARYDYSCRSTLTSCTDHGMWAMAEVEISRNFYYDAERSDAAFVADVYDVILLKYANSWYIVDMYCPESGGPVSPQAEKREMTKRELEAFRVWCGYISLEVEPQSVVRPLPGCFFDCYFDSFDTNTFDAEVFLQSCYAETTVAGDECKAALAKMGLRAADGQRLQKLSVGYLNKLLQEYLPFLPTVPESWKKVKTDGLVYLEKYDAFYRIDSVAFGSQSFNVERGEWDGDYAILYEKGTGDILTLWFSSGRFWLFSHRQG